MTSPKCSLCGSPEKSWRDSRGIMYECGTWQPHDGEISQYHDCRVRQLEAENAQLTARVERAEAEAGRLGAIAGLDVWKEVVSFTVPGRPQQRGSKQAMLIPKRGGGFVEKNGRPIVVAKDDNPKSKGWMSSPTAFSPANRPRAVRPLRRRVVLLEPVEARDGGPGLRAEPAIHAGVRRPHADASNQ